MNLANAKFQLYSKADALGHRIHLPNWVICDRYDRWIYRTCVPEELGPPVRRTREHMEAWQAGLETHPGEQGEADPPAGEQTQEK